MEKLKKSEKLEWIVQYIAHHGWQDVFMEEFVTAYIDTCNPNTVIETLWGAYKVPELSRYLSELYHQGILKRFVVPLNYQCDGYPNWCYGYAIK